MCDKIKHKIVVVLQNHDTKIKTGKVNKLLNDGWTIKESIYVYGEKSGYIPEVLFILEKNETT